ncbi:hypothetical protein EYF80_020092 [Liparis tanakae]|uniref:Uncharacterized protein n=1 Tax=Liparis tanakae TaxID=230148 RepID=A0A4Z2HVM9_9TELE|nr:hypothetical protein EYF80_020092 [Liparis tanakae]
MKQRGGISALQQRTGEVEAGMLLQFEDLMMRDDSKLDYKTWQPLSHDIYSENISRGDKIPIQQDYSPQLI